MKNNTRNSRLKTILVKEQCQEERKALLNSQKVAEIRKWEDRSKYYDETYPKGRFHYTPTDWVRRQEIFNAEPISMDEASDYLYTHRANFYVMQYLKVLTGLCLMAIISL